MTCSLPDGREVRRRAGRGAPAPRRPRRGRPAHPRLPRRRRAVGLPGRPRRVGAALPLRHPQRLARGLPRPRDRRHRPLLRLLRRPGTGADLRARRGPLRRRQSSWRRCARSTQRTPPPRSTWTNDADSGREVAAAHARVYDSVVGGAAVRICLIASSRFPIREPFAGGLESMTWTTARGLAERGHDVTLFAGPGSDTSLPVRLLPLSTGRGQRRRDGRQVRARTAAGWPSTTPTWPSCSPSRAPAPRSTTSCTTTASTTCRSRWRRRSTSRCSPPCTPRRCR